MSRCVAFLPQRGEAQFPPHPLVSQSTFDFWSRHRVGFQLSPGAEAAAQIQASRPSARFRFKASEAGPRSLHAWTGVTEAPRSRLQRLRVGQHGLGA